MSLATRLRAFLKSGSPGGIAPGGDIPSSLGAYSYLGTSPFLLPSTRIDYRVEGGLPTDNAIVVALLNWIARTFPEAPIQVVQQDPAASKVVPVASHPLTMLLARPNEYYSGLLLWQATLTSFHTDGNAYWLKMRNGSGQLRELWYEPHTTIRPFWPDDGSEYISGYKVMRRGHWYPEGDKLIPREDVIHFRNGLNPQNPRLGLSPLASAMREIFTDNEAANFSAALVRNLGIPGVVISPAIADTVIEDPEGLKRELMAKFGGDRKGEPLVMGGPTKIDVLSFSPQQMNLEALRNIPEERICALLGIPAVVTGLGSGWEHSTYSNMKEARAAAYDSNILPTQRLMAAQLQVDLLPELGNPETETVRFDTSQVQALADDQDALYQRQSLAYRAGWIKRSDAREAAGLDTDETDNIYFTDLAHRTEQLQEREPAGELLPDIEKELGMPAKPGKALPFRSNGRKALAPTGPEGEDGKRQLTSAFDDLMTGLRS